MSTTAAYEAFLRQKIVAVPPAGFDVQAGDLNPALFPWQREIVRWALKRGRAALFLDCGLGKTIQQLEWARHVALRTGLPVLILAPLAVAQQTRREGEKFGILVTVCRAQAEVQPGVNVTNYEMLPHFDPTVFGGVVLDESSILKNFMGKTKQALLEAFRVTPFRLCCTATPAPNDHLELGNHADFLGVMPANEMLARWFINDQAQAGNYRLKGHAKADYWRWVSSWAVSLTKPSDLGYPDEGFALPPLETLTHVVEVDLTTDSGGALFRCPDLSSTGIHAERRRTAMERAGQIADLVANTEGPWVLWCETDYEAEALRELIGEAVEVRGSDPLAHKEATLAAFASGGARVLITKPKICGFGLNWQHCQQMAFMGLGYSFEAFYQAVRRMWRFGQTEPVAVHVVLAETELPVLETIERKRSDHEEMKREMQAAMSETQLAELGARQLRVEVDRDHATGNGWELYLGDSCEMLKGVKDNSVHYGLHSPPFSGLYIYSDALQDLGNCDSHEEFFEHYRFIIRELFRTAVPGSIHSVHCKDLPRYKGRDGAAGLYDFPGDCIRAFEAEGWTFHSRVTVWKSPVTEMQRTKTHGLLYKNLRADSRGNRAGMPDYVLSFRKWDGETPFPEPVTHTHESFPLDQWQEWASPVWMDIRQMDVLNVQAARADRDEKHICPLQLDLIERLLVLYSRPGDLVLSPFAGIGSEGYQAVKLGRRFWGCELKREYWAQACRNLRQAEASGTQLSLNDLLALPQAA